VNIYAINTTKEEFELTNAEAFIRVFEEKWEEISKNFPESMREEIKNTTKKELLNQGRYKITKLIEINSIVATKLYEVQRAVILRRIIKPKTGKEVADMFGINPATISHRRKTSGCGLET